ncbi:MAG: hypothetical protein PQJ46_16625 [Spirochaetales bacterium]|nr:hypothetical protein [Spirochaetales bacterium]
MRKYLLIILILIISISGCNNKLTFDTEVSNSPIDITSVSRGAILSANDEISTEYKIATLDFETDSIVISIIGPDGNVIYTTETDDESRIEVTDTGGSFSNITLKSEWGVGQYTIKYDFYADDEIVYSEYRDFFVTDSEINIKSINSYPPVLYPDGGGLFDADLYYSGDECWLRWSFDGGTIAEGSVSDGYESIEIKAPETEGVYDLTLEAFPFAPKEGADYEFESSVKKTIPVYVNTEQSSVSGEFSPASKFYTLFHFRGNAYNSSESTSSGIEKLVSVGSPRLAVKNGIFGYYLDSVSGFSSEGLIIPYAEEKISSFSVMMSVIPYAFFTSSNEESGETLLLYSGYDDFYIKLKILEDGKLRGELAFSDSIYSIDSKNSLFTKNEYSSISFTVTEEDNVLSLSLYSDGAFDSSVKYNLSDNYSLSLPKADSVNNEAETLLFTDNNFTGLVDELGVYYDDGTESEAVDPLQFERAKELEYGNSLVYADGFDKSSEELSLEDSTASIENSILIIPPNSIVELPSFVPAYEEIMINIELEDSSTISAKAVFSADTLDAEGSFDEIASVDLSSKIVLSYGETGEGTSIVDFSLLFMSDGVQVASSDEEEQVQNTGFEGDFSSVSFKIENTSSELPLKIQSIFIVRKSLDLSTNISDE